MKFIIYAEIDIQDEKRMGLLEALNPLIEKVRAQTGCEDMIGTWIAQIMDV